MVAITVRDVPADVRDELAARAARSGKSLQEYLRTMLVDSASKPTVDDVLERARKRVNTTRTSLDIAAVLVDKGADKR